MCITSNSPIPGFNPSLSFVSPPDDDRPLGGTFPDGSEQGMSPVSQVSNGSHVSPHSWTRGSSQSISDKDGFSTERRDPPDESQIAEILKRALERKQERMTRRQSEIPPTAY